MSAKHSPGPWRFGVKDNTNRLYDSDGNVVATGNWKHGLRVEGAINARLIAAAPELLDALRAAVKCGRDGYGHAGAPNCDGCTALAQAEQLVARIDNDEDRRPR